MIQKKALEIEVASTWTTFLQRKALLVGHPFIGLLIGGDGIPFRPLQGSLASLLFIDAVSIFDAATATQMTEEEHLKLYSLKRRLDALGEANKLLNAGACHAIRERRNEVAHQAIEVTPVELDEAVRVLHGELQSWQVVGPLPAYEFHAERSAARASDKPGFSMAFDFDAGVKLAGGWVLRYRVTQDIE